VSGYIRLHRKFLEWEWFDDKNMVKLWVWLVLEAQWRDREFRGRKVRRGQVLTEFRTMARKTNLSVRTVRTCIQRFISTHELTQESTRHGTLLTLCKYRELNPLSESPDTQTDTQDVTQTPHIRRNIEESKEVYIKEKYKKEKIPTLQNLIEVEIPIVLRSLPGFCSLWEDWLKKKCKRPAKDRWSDLKYCVQALALFEKKHHEGCDVIKTLELGEERNWKGWQDDYFEPPGGGSSQTTNKGADWRRQEQNAATAARFKQKPHGQPETGGNRDLSAGSLLKLPQGLNCGVDRNMGRDCL